MPQVGYPIELLGDIDRRQRGACNVRAFTQRHLEQISRVVSPDISPDDYSRGALLPPRRNKDLNEDYSGPR